MNSKETIFAVLKNSQYVLNMTLADLTDQDLLVRPVPNANHIAWQLGHLILTEQSMLKQLGGTPPPLPAGFADQHAKPMAGSDSKEGFATKAEYVELLDKTRGATVAAVEKLSDADLDKPVEGSRMFPKLGLLAIFPASHALMHLGQFSVVRRKLGKPVLF
jgi:DinB superfamily